MTRNYFTNITLEAIIHYIDNTADNSERLIVENWLSSDNSHAIFFNKIKEAWFDLSKIKDFGVDAMDQDWEYILNQIDIAKKNKSTKKELPQVKWLQSRWIQAAAIILLLISVSGGYFIGHSSRKEADSEPLVYNKMEVPKGERSHLILADGTKIWVNAGSTLRFPNRFDHKKREVWLDGEAFFEVAKDKSKPFYVHTSDLNIKVLGTTFNVKAYNDEDIIETTLVEGLVSLESKEGNSKNTGEIFLKPNHKAIFIKNESTLVTEEIKRNVSEPLQARKIIISNPVVVELATSWKEGKLVFEDETLETITKKLERRYDVSIHIEDDAIRELHYTGVLKNVSVEQAMKAIQLTADFQFTLKGNQINIYRNNN